MGSVCSSSEVHVRTTISHHYGTPDREFYTWLQIQQQEHGFGKSVFDDLLSAYVQRAKVLAENERQTWLRLQMERLEEKKIQQITKEFESRLIQVERASQVRSIHTWYEREMEKVQSEFEAYQQPCTSDAKETRITVNEQNIIAPIHIGLDVKYQMQQIQKEEEMYVDWLYGRRRSESVSESDWWALLMDHVHGRPVPGYPGTDDEEKEEPTGRKPKKRFRLDSSDQNGILDLRDNLVQDIQQGRNQFTKPWLLWQLRRYRKDQHRRLISDDQEDESEVDEDEQLADKLLEQIEEGEEAEEIENQVQEYLKDICNMAPGEIDTVDIDEELSERWRLPERPTKEDILARIKIMKLLLSKKIKKARKKDYDDQLAEVCEQDKSYIGQLTSEDLEDKDKLAEILGERLMELPIDDTDDEEPGDKHPVSFIGQLPISKKDPDDEDEWREKIFNDTRREAEDEIRGHKENITEEILQGLVRKHRERQLRAMQDKDKNAVSSETQELGVMEDAEFVDKIHMGDIDAEKLFDLLRGRLTKNADCHTDEQKEVCEMVEEGIKAEIEQLDGKFEEPEVLAILLKYRKRYKEALDDMKEKHEEDDEFVENLSSGLLDDTEGLAEQVEAHLGEDEHLLVGKLAEKYVDTEEHSTQVTDDEATEQEIVPGMRELMVDPQYKEKLDALMEGMQQLLDHKDHLSREELLNLLAEHRQQIALLVVAKRERDEAIDDRRRSVTSEDYRDFKEEQDRQRQEMQDLREDERRHLKKRFKVLLAAKLQSKHDIEDIDDDDEVGVGDDDLGALIEQKKRDDITEEDYLSLMKQHMAERMSLQEHRGKENSRLQEKLRLALQARRRSDNQDETDSGDQEEDAIDKKYRAKLEQRPTEADALEIVRQYRDAQQKMIQDKQNQKKLEDKRVQERLQKFKQDVAQKKRTLMSSQIQREHAHVIVSKHKDIKQQLQKIRQNDRGKHEQNVAQKLAEKTKSKI